MINKWGGHLLALRISFMACPGRLEKNDSKYHRDHRKCNTRSELNVPYFHEISYFLSIFAIMIIIANA